MMTTKIKDLITLPEVRTVVQLSDLLDPSLQEGLKEGFVFTEDVLTNLTIFLDQIVAGQGAGIFLEGSYGSGKSHFLTIISLLLSQPNSWAHFLTKEKRLKDYYLKMKDKRFLVVNISLVSHASREPLEQILAGYLNKAIQSAADNTQDKVQENVQAKTQDNTQGKTQENLQDKAEDRPQEKAQDKDKGKKNNLFFDDAKSRRENFDKLPIILQNLGLDGMVILIDELSEFLRSKADGRSFNEDIRFLQFLGEFSLKHPLWLMASLQERLEDIGAINEESFNKIKDRYKIRLSLTAEHIEALIKSRLIFKKEGAIDQIDRLYSSFKEAFSHLNISKDAFRQLYPVHPYTLTLLDELKFLFSQRRGIVDFIHFQIKGDSSRKIAGIMDNPADSLLGPEYIFDHFLVRIKETTATRIYYQTVYGYFSRELASLFPDEESRIIAQRLIKILMLKAFSPHKKGLTIRELGEMLLCKITSLDSSVNYRFLADIMERLYKDGAYIGYQKGQTFYEDIYYLDLKEDIQGIIRQKSDYIRQGLLPDDERIFDCLAEWVDDPALPLVRLKNIPETKSYLRWQYTGREGFVYIKSFDEISIDKLIEMHRDYGLGEVDFFLFVDKLSHRSRDAFYQKSISEIKEMGENLPFIFWLPQYPEDDHELKDALVYFLLLQKYKDDFTDTGRRIQDYLSSLMPERKKRVGEIFRQAYFNGEIVYCNREGIKKVNEIGILPFDKLLQRIASPSLNHLYPLHKDISPLSDYFMKETLFKVIDNFFRQGEITFEPGMDKGIEILLEGYLKPLKVVKQIHKGYKLNPDSDVSKIVSLYLDKLKGGRVSLSNLYLDLRKGEYGLSRNQFEMLTLAMLFGGQVRGFISGREVNIQRPDFYSVFSIDEIGEGEIIDQRLRDILIKCPFIPQKVKKAGFSFIMQQKAWDSLIEAKKAWSLEEDGFLQMLRHISGYRCLAHMNLKKIEEDFLTLRAMFNEIKVSYTAKDGLERFLTSYRNTPFIDDAYSRLESFRTFSANCLETYANVFSYITDPALVIPEREEYASLLDLRDEVKRVLLDQEMILKEGYITHLVTAFNQFKSAYSLIYQEEHQRAKSMEKFSHYLRLKESSRYRLLSRISRINMISVEDDLVKVNRYLAEVESKICRALDPDQLRKRPVCSCGFKLGETIELIPIKQIEETIDKGIAEYLDTLKEPRYKEQIVSYAVSLEDVGKKKEAEKLKRITDFSLRHDANNSDLSNNDSDINKNADINNNNSNIKLLEDLLADQLINGLNEAFEGRTVIVERDIHDLLENIIDRNFPKDKLLAIFTEWLNHGEKLGSDVYIKIKYKTGKTKDRTIAEMVEQMYPEFIPLIKDVGEELFQHAMITTVWALGHKLPSAHFLRLLNFPSRADFDQDDLKDKWSKVFVSLEKQKGEGIARYFEATEQFLISKGIHHKLLDLLIHEVNDEDLVERLFHEGLFAFSARGITSVLMKRLYSEGEQAKIRRIQKTLAELRERKLKGLSIGSKALAGTRVDTNRYTRLLDHFTQIILALEWLKEAQLSEFDAKMWERAFTENGAGLEILTAQVIKDLEELNIPDSLPIKTLKSEKERFISAFQEGFSEYIVRKYKSLVLLSNMSTEGSEGSGVLGVTGGPGGMESQGRSSGPVFINSLRYHIYEKYKRKLQPGQTHFLLIDAMRWDIWDYCREDILIALKDTYRVVDQVPLWVFLPSITSTQIEPLVTGEPPSSYRTEEKDLYSPMILEEREYYNSGKSMEKVMENGHFFKGTENERFMEMLPVSDNIFTYKYSFIDDKIHTSCEDLLTIYKEIKLNLQSALQGYMENLPAKSMVMLFSDHGFIRKKAHPNKDHKASPYSHGGTSPWEMIVPLVVLYKWR